MLIEEEHGLTDFVNDFSGSSSFKELANKLVEATVNWVKLDRKPDGTSSWLGKFDVTKENFHEIIDLVPRLKEGDMTHILDTVIIQIFDKALLSKYQHQVDEYVNGEWINVQV